MGNTKYAESMRLRSARLAHEQATRERNALERQKFEIEARLERAAKRAEQTYRALVAAEKAEATR